MMSTGRVQDKGRWAGLVAIALTLCACEAREKPDVRQGRVLMHEAQPALERHLDAYIYGDESGAADTHIASTSQNTWCTSAPFMSLLEALQRSRDEAGCAQALAVTSDAEASALLSDEELLMMQTMRFVCEQPQGTCRTYARSVYGSALTQTPYWAARLERYKITAMKDEEGEVRAYVDLEFAAPVGVRRELVVMRHAREEGSAWYVQRGLEEHDL